MNARKVPANYVYDSGEIDYFQLMEDRRVETERHIENLHIRINTLKDELYEEIAVSHKEIMKEIREMKDEQREHAKAESDVLNNIHNRISDLETMKWIVIGGGITMGWLLLGGLDALKNLLS